ncbi:J domain-containing protein [Campylobacter sp. MOP7]|uniref:J domain-containing protein n=1 Tax=Campylobacter canis TaxID=3378588 RepID=UPI00387EA88C
MSLARQIGLFFLINLIILFMFQAYFFIGLGILLVCTIFFTIYALVNIRKPEEGILSFFKKFGNTIDNAYDKMYESGFEKYKQKHQDIPNKEELLSIKFPNQKYVKAMRILQIQDRTLDSLDLEFLKTSFKNRAKQLHPDMNPHLDTTDDMQELNDSYKILKEYLIQRSL